MACECGRVEGQCIRGDLDFCPNWQVHFDDLCADDDEHCPEGDEEGESDCGRWRNGKLVHDCLRAGEEWCDWDCPLNGDRNRARIEAMKRRQPAENPE